MFFQLAIWDHDPEQRSFFFLFKLPHCRSLVSLAITISKGPSNQKLPFQCMLSVINTNNLHLSWLEKHMSNTGYHHLLNLNESFGMKNPRKRGVLLRVEGLTPIGMMCLSPHKIHLRFQVFPGFGVEIRPQRPQLPAALFTNCSP